MDFSLDGIPPQLRERDQWICWALEEREDKEGNPTTTKVPRDPRSGAPGADPTDPDVWASLETAVATAEEHGIGIGFCFNADGLIAGVDLDDCVNPETGQVEKWAAGIVEQLDSWTQISTSGTGLHIYVLGFVPDGGNRRGDVEMYDQERFFAVTGDHLEGTPTEINIRKDQLRDVHAEWILQEDDDEDQQTLDELGAEPADLSLEELVEKATAATNGEKFAALWHGDTSGYDSHSEADMALCNLLAFWTAGDRARMDALFRRSGLMREKWDEDRGSQTYGERTIEAARSYVTDYYTPGERAERPLEGVDDPDPTPTEEQLEAMLTPEDEAADGGGGTTSGGGGLSPWSTIRAEYRRANEHGQPTAKIRQQARYVATRRLEEDESHFATNEVSGHLYVYDDGRGIYLDRGEAYVQERLVEELREQYTTTELNEIVAQIKGRTFHHPDEFGGPPGTVNVENGILLVDRNGVVDFIDHTPRHLFLSQVQTAYEPDTTCPTFERMLENNCPREEDRLTVQEFVGYTLMHWTTSLQRALFIVGDHDSGKSTFLDLVRDLLGSDSVSSVAPHSLGENRFAAHDLWRSWANIRNELSAALLNNSEMFKQVVTGDQIRVEQKNEKAFEIKPRAKHLYAANELPQVKSSDSAFYKRVLIVEFPYTIPEDDQKGDELDEQLREELPGILNWALEGLERLMDQGRFTGDLNPADTRDLWQSWGDSVQRFKRECLEFDPAAWVPKSAARKVYTAYCGEMDMEAVGQRKLTTELKKDTRIGDADRTPPGESRQTSCYTGFRIKVEWAEHTDGEYDGRGDAGDEDGDEDGDDDRDGHLDEF